MINNDSLNWTFKIETNLGESIFITENDIFNLMSFEVIIIEDSIHFHLSDSILSSEVASLFYGKWFNTWVIVVFKNWLKNVNSWSF